MPARKSRGNKQGISQKNSKKGSPGRSSLKFLFSPPVILAFLFVLAICLAIAFWPDITAWLNRLSEDTMATINAAWLSLLQSTGLGIIFIIIAVISLILILSNPRIFSRNWNYWLGAVAFAVAAWGLLSYIRPASGMFVQASLGGSIGKAIATDSPVAGVLIVSGLILLGIFLVAPEWLWSVIKRTSKGTAGLAGEIVDVMKENRTSKKGAPAEVEVEEETPAAVEQPEEIPAPADTGIMDRMRSSIVVGGWSLPNINILDKVQEAVISDQEIDKRRETIEEALNSYGVQAKVIEVNRGPTVTQFGVEPGWDIKYREVRDKDRDGNVSVRQEEVQRTRVKVERISSLANDLALALAAPSIRIEAPVPGKSVVGIEVPNTTFGSVGLRGVMESTAFQKMLAKSRLAIALGKGAGGETVVADMTKMPHLLIAGATGSGKSVCLNSIICCLMMNNTPDSVKYLSLIHI